MVSRYPLRLDADLKMQLEVLAEERKTSVNALIVKACQEKVARERKGDLELLERLEGIEAKLHRIEKRILKEER